MLQKESNIHQEVSILSQISQRIGVFLNSSDKFSPVHHGYLQLVQNSNPNLPKEISSTSLASAILKEKEKQVEDAKQVNSKQSEQNNSTSSKPSSKAKSVIDFFYDLLVLRKAKVVTRKSHLSCFLKISILFIESLFGILLRNRRNRRKR